MYTPEMVQAIAQAMQTDDATHYAADAAHMLEDYAATLRQQVSDVETMLNECVPGGSIVDPQLVCDNIREWFLRNTLRQAPAQGGVTEADEPIGHPRSETDTRDEIELFLRDAYAAGCHAARATSPMLAITYAHREAPKLRAALSAQQGQGEACGYRAKNNPDCFMGPAAVAAQKAMGWDVSADPEWVPVYTAPPAQPAERVPEELRVLSERASTDWKVDDRKIGGGAVVGGPVFHYTNGSGQTQVATFSCPRQDDDDPRDPTVVQNANARFAVECVNYVRGLLAASPAPSPARTIYDHRVRVDEACRDAAPRLYSALKNLLDAVKERPDNMGIESVVTGDAENALLAASPARGDGGEG